MKGFFAFLGLLVTAEALLYSSAVLKEWNQFKLTHNKTYESDAEEEFRLQVFLDTKRKISEHNTRYENGLVSFRLGMNQFGDMTHHEYITKTKCYINERRTKKTAHKNPAIIEEGNVEFANKVDWREKGAVTDVKSQGSCGSCWAFSVIGALEGLHFRTIGKLVTLSEQNLVDCSRMYGNRGCHGGELDGAFSYIMDRKGIDTDKSYPYEAKDDDCHYKAKEVGATAKDYVEVESGNEYALKKAVAVHGPVSVAIDASQDTFQNYEEGVYYEPKCNSTELNHAVLVVGYGTTEDGTDYWLVKNSWGRYWGERGYIKMARNMNNNCGIATEAIYVV